MLGQGRSIDSEENMEHYYTSLSILVTKRRISMYQGEIRTLTLLLKVSLFFNDFILYMYVNIYPYLYIPIHPSTLSYPNPTPTNPTFH